MNLQKPSVGPIKCNCAEKVGCSNTVSVKIGQEPNELSCVGKWLVASQQAMMSLLHIEIPCFYVRPSSRPPNWMGLVPLKDK